MTDQKLPPNDPEVRAKLERIALLEERRELRDGLPHLYSFPFYPWSREFFESRNQINVVCAANQISKSSTQIRKAIHWATAKHLWPSLWRTPPRQFWYMYPSYKLLNVEVLKKWIPEFLPRGKFKDDEVFGWEIEKYNGNINAIHFRSGVSIYFKTYSQAAEDLQGSTVYAMFLDEEPPEELMDELFLRLVAVDGYMHAVFTPTLGQEFWREVLEVKGSSERLPFAYKRQVAMYDCLKYEDGLPSPWTVEKIKRIENACKSEAEIQRRVYGRFVLDSGLKYSGFTRSINLRPSPGPIPDEWNIYVGIDFGSGGDNHPSAVTFVGVAPDYKSGRVFKGRRFDGEVTTAGDLVAYANDMILELPNPDKVLGVYYDYSAVDLKTISLSLGKSWLPAEKSHAIGEQVINVLFKNGMMTIDEIEELNPLVVELMSVKRSTAKNLAKDDAVDSFRYAVSKVPWDWSAITVDSVVKPVETILTPKQQELKDRRDFVTYRPEQVWDVESELEFWNDLY